ncbi:MAG: hypothetical protein ACD_11C00030G0021 [uncultured bacterium]|nr:MAG: hypothetical protein ACD_11C00030G0021 [uncultured bacterium]HBR71642.1 hypothetical protein [Candidatus Moranbacteria bacterium]
MKISIKQYAQTLFDLTDGKSEQEISDVVKKFFVVLKKDGQIKNSKRIIEKFSETWNVVNGIVEAEVTTISAMEKATSDKIEKFVKEKYLAKKVVIKNIIDEKIKGGLILRVGNEVLDASVNNQLEKLGKFLQK